MADRRRMGGWWPARLLSVSVIATSLGAFLLMAALETRAIIGQHWPAQAGRSSLSWYSAGLLLAALTWAMMAVPGMLLARRGARVLAFVPAAAVALAAWSDAVWWNTSWAPGSNGTSMPLWSSPVAVAGVAIALAPCVLFALRTPERVPAFPLSRVVAGVAVTGVILIAPAHALFLGGRPTFDPFTSSFAWVLFGSALTLVILGAVSTVVLIADPGVFLRSRGIRNLALVPAAAVAVVTWAFVLLGAASESGGHMLAIANVPLGYTNVLVSEGWWQLAVLLGFAIACAPGIVVGVRARARRSVVPWVPVLVAATSMGAVLVVLSHLLARGPQYDPHSPHFSWMFAVAAFAFAIGWDARSFRQAVAAAVVLLAMHGGVLLRIIVLSTSDASWVPSFRWLVTADGAVEIIVLALLTMPLARTLERLRAERRSQLAVAAALATGTTD